MPHSADKYITRVDRNRMHGYLPRVQRVEKAKQKPTVASQLFSDSKYGGKQGARAAARQFVVAALETLPRRNTDRQPKKAGYGYSRRTTYPYKSRAGVVERRPVCEAVYKFASGKRAETRYSIGKSGAAGAQFKADAWLARMGQLNAAQRRKSRAKTTPRKKAPHVRKIKSSE